MHETTTPTSNATGKSTLSQRASTPTIDIEQLAAKVYQLMVEDTRLMRARGLSSRTRK